MTLTSYSFLIFLPMVLFLSLICPSRLRVGFLALASLFFYGLFKPAYLAVILLVIIGAYGCGILLEKKPDKRIFILGILISVGILAIFKYTGFLWELFGKAVRAGGAELSDLPFSIVQPVGVSYFTFQVISYLTDVYRGKEKAERNFWSFALFISFFPKIISGPVERANSFLTQIHSYPEKKLWDYTRITQGFQRMIWGFFLKLVIADRINSYVTTVFGNYQQYGSVELWVGCIGFTLQLYADFNGYVNIASGAAKVLGFDLTENFHAPLFSGSITEFWTRWHISLGSWLRDYIYIPLGGNRKGLACKCRNLLITFLVSGIWHGAGLNFIFWGMLHGIFQTIETLTRKTVNEINDRLGTRTDSFGYRLFQKLKCFILVAIAFNFFKVESITDGLKYCYYMFAKWNPWRWFDGTLYTLGVDEKFFKVIFLAVILMLLVDHIKDKKNYELDEWLETQCIWFRYGFLLLLLAATIVFGAYGPSYSAENFIYFQF